MRHFTEVRKLITLNWKVLAGFELLYKLACTVLLVPLLWGMFDLIMLVRGYAYLTLENVAAFLASPLTLFLILLLLLLVTMIAMIDISAVVFILDQSRQKRRVHIWQVLKFSLRNACRAWNPRNLLLILVVLLLIPFLNIGMASGVLSTISIPEFILDYIRANAFLSLLLTAVTLFCSILVMRWLYAFHYFTLEGCAFGEARRRSRQLGGKRRLRDFMTLFVLQMVCFVLYLLTLLLFIALAVLAGKLFSGIFVLKWLASTLVWLVIVCLIAVAWALAMPVSYGCISVLYYKHKEQKGERIVHSEAPSYYREGLETLELDRKQQRRIRRTHWLHVLLGGVVVAASLTLGFLLCSGRLKPEITYNRSLEITAHRGASAFYPENTMSAFEGAKKLGADWIELDVQQTKDGQIVVSHDPNLQRITGVSANIRDLTYEEIKEFDAGSFFDPAFAGERIPLLSEVAEFSRESGIQLNIELKPAGQETEFEKQVIEVVRQAGIADSCVITSQIYEVLENVKAYDSSISTVYVMSLAYGDINQLAAADHFSVEAASATRSLISRVHEAGKQMFVWTVNTAESINQMIALDVDHIITDDIELARRCIYESRYSDLLAEYLKLFQ